MADFYLNLSLTQFPKHSLHAKARINRGDTVEDAVRQMTGFADVLESGELDVAFLVEHVGAYMAAAFASGETHRFSQSYGDDGTGYDWRLYIDGITDAEIERQDSFDLLGKHNAPREEVEQAIFVQNRRGEMLTLMVRLDESAGLLDTPEQTA